MRTRTERFKLLDEEALTRSAYPHTLLSNSLTPSLSNSHHLRLVILSHLAARKHRRLPLLLVQQRVRLAQVGRRHQLWLGQRLEPG